jgi:aspartate kinase
MKFGGTSVGSPQAHSQAADIVLREAQGWTRLAVVVSAMSGVTDALVRGARTAVCGDEAGYRAVITELRTSHEAAIEALLDAGDARVRVLWTLDQYLEELRSFYRSVHVLHEVTPRAMDAICSFGERVNARILAALLRQRGLRSKAVDATQWLVTDATFQKAAPLMTPTRERAAQVLMSLMAQDVVPITTGFIGATEDGVTTTLGRGGSDYSAAILAAALDADALWVWSDVDGVLSADPRVVADARTIPVLSSAEVSELAYYGAKVLHPQTIRPVMEQGIPLVVKNTFNPQGPATQIVHEAEKTPGTVKGVTAIEGVSMITVAGHGMVGVPGIAARTFSAVASTGASVFMISQASSEQAICFVISADAVQPVVKALETALASELGRHDVERIWSIDEVVVVTAVGAGMRRTPGVAARLFGALGDVNALAIAQGSSECSISLVVAAEDAGEAVRRIHEEVIVNGARD